MRLIHALCIRVGKYTKDYSNLPERYIQRASEMIEWKTPNEPNYLPRTVYARPYYYFPVDRPWTKEFKDYNRPDIWREREYVEPIKDWSFFRGDRVEILTGKDKGKQGLVFYIVQERNWVLVRDLNCMYKVVGKTDTFPGIMIRWEEPLLVTTDIQLVDPSDNKPTTIEWRYTEHGERVRVSTRSGRIIPTPVVSEETIDYKTKASYAETSKDTVTAELTKITFDPKLKTFEMEIMDEMGIKEDRMPHKTYWY